MASQTHRLDSVKLTHKHCYSLWQSALKSSSGHYSWPTKVLSCFCSPNLTADCYTCVSLGIDFCLLTGREGKAEDFNINSDAIQSYSIAFSLIRKETVVRRCLVRNI